MKSEALRLIAASPNLARSEKAVLALGAVGSKIDVQAEDLSWGETWLVTEHVPSLDKMKVWPIPNTLWRRSAETRDVQFETYTLKDGGLHGWHIYRTADDVLMTDAPFASAELARSYVLTTLHSRAIA